MRAQRNLPLCNLHSMVRDSFAETAVTGLRNPADHGVAVNLVGSSAHLA